MEEKDIIEGNRLIAEFEGLYITPYNGKYHFVCKEKKKEEDINQAWMFRLEEAEYHTSWDWIMPVVEKIDNEHCNDFETIIYSSSCHIKAVKRGNASFMGTGKKIDAVWSCVVEFIKWYNANTPNK